MRKITLWSLLLSLVLAQSACGPREKVVKLAVAVPLTGDEGTEGQGVRRAAEMAVEEANAAKRFPFKLELKALDDRADPKEAVNVANLLVSDPDVIAVIGHFNSGCTIPAAKVYARAGIPMISPSATNPDVTAQQLKPDWVGQRIVFRVIPTDDVQGAFAADFAYRKFKLRKVAVVHDKTPYGEGLADRFKAAFEKAGGTVLSFNGIAVGDKDFKALLTRIKSENPQGLYFGGLYSEAGLILRQAKELGLKATFLSGDSARTDTLYQVAGDAADGAYMTMVGIPVEDLPAAKDFIARYKKRFTGASEEMKPYDHFAFEAAQIVFAALEKAGPDRAKFLDALRKTHYKGMLGLTTFDEKGDTLNKTITVTRANFKNKSFDPVR